MSDEFVARLRKKIMATFEAEARERLQAITNSLLSLERKPSPEESAALLDDIFREAHTLKGSARGLDIEDIGHLAHKLENVFTHVQKGELAATPAVFDAVYRCLDTIGLIVTAEAVGNKADVSIPDMVAVLENLTGGAPAAQAANVDVAEPTEPLLPPIPAVPVPPPPASDVTAALPPVEATLVRTVDASMSISERANEVSATHLVVALTAEFSADKPRKDAGKASENTVRVAISKLDNLMALVGEIQVTRVSTLRRLSEIGAFLDLFEAWESEWGRTRADCRKILQPFDPESLTPESRAANAEIPRNLPAYLRNSEGRLKTALAQVNLLRRNFKSDSRRMAQVVADLQDEVRYIRMLPVSTVFQTFPRMIRDLSRQVGKEVEFVMNGGDNEMDRSVIEQISGPLVHLLRNCVDHGLEMPDVRESAGKPRVGKLTISASQQGGSILVEVSDDGAGIDANRVKASAVKKGLITADAAAAMTEREAIWLIFRSGVSTRTEITDISGRGVGMDAVREHVERMNGIIDIETKLGKGTRFTLSLPLTVATTLSLLIQSSGLTFALPVSNVIRIMRIKPSQIGSASGRAVVHVDGRHLALISLSETLGIEQSVTQSSSYLAIIVGSVEDRTAFIVDTVLGTQEVMIKSLPKPMIRVPCIAGATILGTGEIAIILNAADLSRTTNKGGFSLESRLTKPVVHVKTVLIADDSVTVRSLQKSIIENAGYKVQMACDGLDAWTILQHDTFDMVISDVNMPRMDGLELTAKIRADSRLKELPIVLVTSLSTQEDRERGMEAGADAYIVKSMFEQDRLLETIRRLI
ncbi:MAG: hybrid sensor histidine kinase/response regulator [Planctomycetota bacterium]